MPLNLYEHNNKKILQSQVEECRCEDDEMKEAARRILEASAGGYSESFEITEDIVNDFKHTLYMETFHNNPEDGLSADKDILSDFKYNSIGEYKEVPWREKKMKNEELAKIYSYFDEAKSLRLRDCGKFLDFRVYEDGSRILNSMTSCRVRLCPICAWRRSLKTFYNNLKIMQYLREVKGKEYNFIFLTLTVRNCQGYELNRTINEMFAGLHRLYERPEWKRAFKGTCRCLEVTHNVDRKSEFFDTYHPHFHFLIAVNKSYFTSGAYLSHEKIQELWADVMRLDYAPNVHVKRCYNNDPKVVAECSKYAAKDEEYVLPEDWKLSLKTVKLLDESLANRRLIGYTGCFREARRILMEQERIQDEENGSLVNVGDTEELPELDYKIQTYYWYSGYKQYISVK